MRSAIALFGSAEKGPFCNPIQIRSLPELLDKLGDPLLQSEGIHYAIQSLLFGEPLIYFRVAEEGCSIQDYMAGLHFLKKNSPSLTAICLPGACHEEVVHAALSLCHKNRCLLMLSENDLYDYLTLLK